MKTELFDNVFWDNREAILRYCSNFCQNIDEAEDITQEVFIAFQENIQNFDDGTQCKPWLYRVAKNKCLNTIRDRKLHKEKEAYNWSKSYFANTTQVYIVDKNKGPVTEVIQKEANANLISTLDSLPELTRETLLLKYSEQLTRQEIAETLDISLAKVKRLLAEGLQFLKKDKKIQ